MRELWEWILALDPRAISLICSLIAPIVFFFLHLWQRHDNLSIRRKDYIEQLRYQYDNRKDRFLNACVKLSYKWSLEGEELSSKIEECKAEISSCYRGYRRFCRRHEQDLQINPRILFLLDKKVTEYLEAEDIDVWKSIYKGTNDNDGIADITDNVSGID